VQLLALPFALHSFGTDRYASFLALQSLLSWTGLCGLGLSLALPKFVADANARGDRREERNLVVTAILLLGVASVLLIIVLVGLGEFVPPERMIGLKMSVSADELRSAYLIATFISAAQLIAGIQASLRAGYQEVHRASICAMIASIFFVLPGLFFVSQHKVSISVFLLIMYAPLALVFFCDHVLLFFEREYLRNGAVDLCKTAGWIIFPSGNALAYQVEYALIVYLPTLVVAHLSTAVETAAFGSVLQLIALGGSSLNFLFQPYMSATANAHSHGDVHWIQRNYKRFALLVLGIGAIVFVGAATVGPTVVHAWLGKSIFVSRSMMAAFGVYFLVFSLSISQFYVLSAMGALKGTGWIYLSQGALALLLGSVLCAYFGAVGMTIGLTVSLALTSWVFPVRVLKAIRSMRKEVEQEQG
jgi:O-antigen/teichoic acid export membrane protein